MKRFVLFIFLFLMCFLFMIPGASFAGIVPETTDNQTTIKNKKGNTMIKADGRIASEIGTVLKCPIYRQF